jgi:malonyl-CoA/methylmalonyl-CoA synthetase
MSKAASHQTPNANLYSALRAAFPADRKTIAIETDNELFYTWSDLERASAMIANLFAALELEPGARIVVQVEKSVEAMLLYLACLRAGYVFVPLNTAYKATEMEYFIGNAEPAVVVCSRAHAEWVGPIAKSAGTGYLFTLDDDRTGTLLELAAQCSDRHVPVRSDDDDLAAIIYTSGTTGRSKGAMLSHRNLLANAEVLKDYWGWVPGDVLIHTLPIFHVHGLFVALNGALLNGSKMLWFSRFDAARIVPRLPDATIFMGVPTLYGRLLADPGLTAKAVRKMRLFTSGSAPLLVDMFNAWRERTGHTILERYGMSETNMITSNPYNPVLGERKGGTVGFPLPGVQLRVVAAEDGNPDDEPHLRSCGIGEIGSIQVSGPNVFAGYWRMPEKTREEFTADGFFKTGDVGKVDGLGYVTIVGRTKDLIISGGLNVYPAEVEACLNELPGVAESAVVGVPHPDFGEVGVAVVVAEPETKLGAPQLLAALKERLAGFKVPKYCLLVDALPRNVMGKVQKALLREKHRALFVKA